MDYRRHSKYFFDFFTFFAVKSFQTSSCMLLTTSKPQRSPSFSDIGNGQVGKHAIIRRGGEIPPWQRVSAHDSHLGHHGLLAVGRRCHEVVDAACHTLAVRSTAVPGEGSSMAGAGCHSLTAGADHLDVGVVD